MKKKLLQLVCTTLIYMIFSGCGDTPNTKKELSEEEIYQNKINAELLKDTVVNDIFLNLNFGDNSETVLQKLNKISSDNNLLIGSKWSGYTYYFKFDEEYDFNFNTGVANLEFEYYDNKLYKLILSVEPRKDYMANTQTDANLLYYNLTKLFNKKFGYHHMEKKQTRFPEKQDALWNKYWVHGNRLISIEINYYSVDVVYTDLLTLRIVEELENKKEEKEKQKRKVQINQSETDI
jgi:hypothetical protein